MSDAISGAVPDAVPGGAGAADALVVFEDLELKHRVLREVEPMLRADAIYASNTSTIPIARLSAIFSGAIPRLSNAITG